MPQVKVILLWHMHQPFYKDLVSGEYRLPWVRMHALKDYYGMVKLLEEFSEVHQTFNLVPSLIVQIQDYLSGSAQDPQLRVAAKPARELSPDERRFALDYLFQANVEHMIGRHPRYRELLEQFQHLGNNAERGAKLFQAQDFTDLQVLSQLAWFDEFFRHDPEIAALIEKQRQYTEDDQRLVTAKQTEIMAAVLPAYAQAADRGAIEISSSPFYHPILPLLADTDIAAVSSPGLKLPRDRFQHPEDVREQIKRGLDLHQKVFGRRPRGMWPSEGGVSDQTIEIAHELGIEWMATDEGVLARTLAAHFRRDENGNLAPPDASALYQLYRYERGNSRMHLLFRDHSISDLIGFVYSGVPAPQAAEDFIRRIKRGAEPVLKQGRDAYVAVILDGENAWEFYPASGREFLRRVYAAIQSDHGIQALTVSEAIAEAGRQIEAKGKKPATPRGAFAPLSSITPGSWIDANFNVWIGAPEDNRSWECLGAARQFYQTHAAGVPARDRDLALEELLIAEGSDWNWWYGPEHHSANDRDFDELYRKHLSNVFHALGAAPPDYLAQPIALAGGRPSFVPQTAYIHPNLQAEFARYFDWIGAAMYTADRRAGAMHGKQFLLDSVYAGIDESNLYGRLDFAAALPEGKFELVVACESVSPLRDGTSRRLRLEVRLEDGRIAAWKLCEITPTSQPQAPGTAPPAGKRGAQRDRAVAGSSQRRQRGVEMLLRQSFEFKMPLALLEARIGTSLRLRFSLWREHLPIDALPVEGSIQLRVAPEEELEADVYNYGVES